jgi:hypothetical protein
MRSVDHIALDLDAVALGIRERRDAARERETFEERLGRERAQP